MPSPKLFRVGRSATGLGLFATQTIAKRTVIVEYRGRRIPTKVALARERRSGSRYMFEIDRRWTIDGSSRRNLARYVNHSCKPNAEAELVRGRMLYRARRRIAPGEEITLDYGEEYVALFFSTRGCLCAACKARVSSSKTSRPRRSSRAQP